MAKIPGYRAASAASVRPLIMELDPTCHDEDRRSWEPQISPRAAKQIKQIFFFKKILVYCGDVVNTGSMYFSGKESFQGTTLHSSLKAIRI